MNCAGHAMQAWLEATVIGGEIEFKGYGHNKL